MHTGSLRNRCLRRQIFVKSADRLQTLTLDLDPKQSTVTLANLNALLPLSLQSRSFSDFCFVLNGKPLDASIGIPVTDISPLSTLVVHPRIRGGGGDGGATGAESRDCYLNMYAEKKPDKVDPNEQRLSKWLNCALSNESLSEPCVIDRLGNLFNKEALVHALLSKRLPKQFSHIKGLKDMVNINLTAIPGSDMVKEYSAKFQCPISGLEFNGLYKFYALRGCGHVLSAKALKEVKSSSCLVCHADFTESDKIVINGTEEEVDLLRKKMEDEKTKLREKKTISKKAKNSELVASNTANEDHSTDSCRVINGLKRGNVQMEKSDRASAKVEMKVKLENGKGGNGIQVKKFKATDIAPANATKEVYASIFTSSRKSDFKETYSCRSLPLGRN